MIGGVYKQPCEELRLLFLLLLFYVVSTSCNWFKTLNIFAKHCKRSGPWLIQTERTFRCVGLDCGPTNLSQLLFWSGPIEELGKSLKSQTSLSSKFPCRFSCILLDINPRGKHITYTLKLFDNKQCKCFLFRRIHSHTSHPAVRHKMQQIYTGSHSPTVLGRLSS